MKNEPMKHLHFDRLCSPLEEPPLSYEVAKIAAQVTDLTDRAITEAIIEAATKEGLTDLYLIDKRFIFEAIAEKVEREKNEPLTLEELRQMYGEPVWLDIYEWRVCYGTYTSGGIEYLETGLGCGIPLSGYGRSWNAYRRKPKKEAAADGTPKD